MLTSADQARVDALRTELATILGYHDPSRPTLAPATLTYVGVCEVGPQRALGCELYRDVTGDVYAVGFADHDARSVFRVALSPIGVGRDVTLLEVVYDWEAIRDAVAEFASAAGGGGRPEVRRRAVAELARAMGGASRLVVEMATAIATTPEGA
jgi:hypothetical protein